VLVQADRQHPGVVVERGLHPVAVVRVDVHVGDAPGTLPKQPGDRDRHVVVDPEPARAGGHRVMHAARDAGPVLGRARPDSTGCGQGGPGHQCRRLLHAGEDRVVPGAQPEPPRVVELGRVQTAGTKVVGPATDRLDGRNVPRLMHKLQVRVSRWGRGGHGHPRLIPQSELVREPHRQLHAHRCQRMTRPEVIVSQPLIPGHMHGAGHLPTSLPP